MHDIVIRDALLIDGSGTPRRTADVAVHNGLIVDVDEAPGAIGAGRREVAADGRLLTPGFVDIHTHYDAQASWDPMLTPSSWHGCTTVVMGNCGVGFAPARPDRHDWLIELMEGVEDIPGSAMAEGITWEWETFPEYLDALDRQHFVMDVGTQVAHGPLRAYVMGERGAHNEEATADDLTELQRLVVEGLRAGALGFSTSRTPIHRSKSGELVPGTTCSVDELLACGDALGIAGHGVFQGAFWHPDVPNELSWMETMATRTGRPVCFNLNQVNSHPHVWRDVLNSLSDFHRRGLPVYAQAAGRAIGVIMSLEGSFHPFMGNPAWEAVKLLPMAEQKATLLARRDEAVAGVNVDLTGWFLAERGVIEYEPDPAVSSIGAVAARLGADPRVLLLDHMCAYDHSGFVYWPVFNYANGDLSMLEALHRHPATRMGLGDAGAHCGAICDGGMPTFMLTHWARDRTRGPKLELESVIHRQTRQTALLYGLSDRGLVAPGLRADLALIDFDALHAEPAKMVYDFPGGARRLAQRAHGYDMVMCGGTVTVEHDTPTGALPGRLLRGPR